MLQPVKRDGGVHLLVSRCARLPGNRKSPWPGLPYRYRSRGVASSGDHASISSDSSANVTSFQPTDSNLEAKYRYRYLVPVSGRQSQKLPVHTEKLRKNVPVLNGFFSSPQYYQVPPYRVPGTWVPGIWYPVPVPGTQRGRQRGSSDVPRRAEQAVPVRTPCPAVLRTVYGSAGSR